MAQSKSISGISVSKCQQRDANGSMSKTVSLLFLVCLIFFSLAVSSCGGDRTAVFDPTGERDEDKERQLILAEIQNLAAGKDLNQPDNVVMYHKSVDNLIARGSAIETMITEAIGGENDWGIRLGAIEVLKGIGTHACIETLLGALEDPHPLVALNANYLLRALTDHTVIPEAGEPAKDGLPPVPKRAENDLALDADEKLWATWHAQHKVELHRVWREWWIANKAKIAVQ